MNNSSQINMISIALADSVSTKKKPRGQAISAYLDIQSVCSSNRFCFQNIFELNSFLNLKNILKRYTSVFKLTDSND